MFRFGVDYYPEQWPEQRWPLDAAMMAETGFNVVRLAEFAWSRLEPEEGKFDFGWLDRAIEILSGWGIQVVLGTPTASPPAWLMSAHPDFFRVREDGVRVTYGNRREYCPNHPLYRDYSCRIVSAMAEHYARHPAVIGWQIDNEFGERCYCPACAQAFRQWLRGRYGSLSRLNESWGTAFWSHTYTDWDQVPVPSSTGGSPNPGLALDYSRFASDSYVSYQQDQVDILRTVCPDHFVTHDLMGFKYDRLNYYDLTRPLDFVSWNNYPRSQWSMQEQVDPAAVALAHDTMRGLKRANFWVMEQQAGPGGWEIVSVAPRPGELRLWVYQSIAHGADGILFFRWRSARFGTEQYWHGLLEHDGHPSRRLEEIRRVGAELRAVGEEIAGSVCRPAAAMLLSYDSRFAFQIQPNNPEFSYPEQFEQLYRSFHSMGIPLDIVEPDADLGPYKVVIAPALHVLPKAAADNLERYVQSGGILAVTPRSGVKDEANAVVERPLPGLLAGVCGAQVEEYDSLPPGGGALLEFTSPSWTGETSFTCRTWCDILRPTTAEVVARYTRGYFAGRPAITLNRSGKGLAVYIGTIGGDELNDSLARWLAGLGGLSPVLAPPDRVEVTERRRGDARLLFVLNHAEQQKDVTLDGRYTELLSGQAREGTITLDPCAVMILKA